MNTAYYHMYILYILPLYWISALSINMHTLNFTANILNNDITSAYKVMSGKTITPQHFAHIKSLKEQNNWSLHNLALYLVSLPIVREHLRIEWLPIKFAQPAGLPIQQVNQELVTPRASIAYTDEEIIGTYRVMTGHPITPADFELCKKYRPILPRFLLILDDTIANLEVPPLHTIDTFPIKLRNDMTIFGYKSDRFIAEALAQQGIWEPYMEKLMRKLIKPGDTVIDIGANIGYFTAVFAECVGKNGSVIAFEPLPPLAQLIERCKMFNTLPQITVYPYALSDRTENMLIKINPISPGVSHSVDAATAQECERKIPDTIATVKAISLDAILKTSLQRLDFIKIDVEGMEDLVFKGAEQHIRKFLPIIVWEFSPHLYAKRKVSAEQLLQYFEQMGYVFGIVPDLAPLPNPLNTIRLRPLSSRQIINALSQRQLQQLDLVMCHKERAYDVSK